MDDYAIVILAVAALVHVPLVALWLVVVWRRPDDREATALLAVMSLIVMVCAVCCYYPVRGGLC